MKLIYNVEIEYPFLDGPYPEVIVVNSKLDIIIGFTREGLERDLYERFGNGVNFNVTFKKIED